MLKSLASNLAMNVVVSKKNEMETHGPSSLSLGLLLPTHGTPPLSPRGLVTKSSPPVRKEAFMPAYDGKEELVAKRRSYHVPSNNTNLAVSDASVRGRKKKHVLAKSADIPKIVFESEEGGAESRPLHVRSSSYVRDDL